MINLAIIADLTSKTDELQRDLAQAGYSCTIISDRDDETIMQVSGGEFSLALLAVSSRSSIQEITSIISQTGKMPVIALFEPNMLNDADGSLTLTDDFIVKPYNIKELDLRMKRLLRRPGVSGGAELVIFGDLAIDTGKCEVYLSGNPVTLTFKEYELLKFLVNNRGRVFSREALLNQVWGYDYYGGDRTVDVHVRRLRSKIEDSTHVFIETVRNIGYRFKENA